MKCPVCGTSNVYIGLNLVECTNRSCRLYTNKEKKNLARVVWNINGNRGKSKWMPVKEAIEKIEQDNSLFGEGTHWIELDDGETFTFC